MLGALSDMPLIGCKIREIWTDAGTEYDCDYPYGVDCGECILNGGEHDPRTGRKFVGRHKGELKKYRRAFYKRIGQDERKTIESSFDFKLRCA
jgi:hypothetical protein